MNASALPEWNKIGRRVGKVLRDIFHPPKDTGPSPQEREAARLQDVLRGFAYFDTFDELISWSLNDVDPVQQANTPLLRRSEGRVHDCAKPSTKLTLCHDYKGGYHDYESVRPGLQSEELYSCEYLQYVETFIYFSHKLVCCPPPSWTNLLHRNGVKVLGTFIVEPQTPGIERMLECKGGDYLVATQLAAIADTFGFDGWLLNIEKEFSRCANLLEKLTYFITALKRRLGPEGLVIWYDALTIDNEVEYQNALTIRNAEFARHADALFTNYKWTIEKLNESRRIAEELGIFPSDIYFGIDVWAQNTNMPGPLRITYPHKGGGGTNTGLVCLPYFFIVLPLRRLLQTPILTHIWYFTCSSGLDVIGWRLSDCHMRCPMTWRGACFKARILPFKGLHKRISAQSTIEITLACSVESREESERHVEQFACLNLACTNIEWSCISSDVL